MRKKPNSQHLAKKFFRGFRVEKLGNLLLRVGSLLENLQWKTFFIFKIKSEFQAIIQ